MFAVPSILDIPDNEPDEEAESLLSAWIGGAGPTPAPPHPRTKEMNDLLDADIEEFGCALH